MGSVSTIAAFDFITGAVAAIGLAYLLYAESLIVYYPRFFKLMLVGLLIYAITGPIIGLLDPSLIHAVHGIATLFVTVGLYGLVDRRLEDTTMEGTFGIAVATGDENDS